MDYRARDNPTLKSSSKYKQWRCQRVVDLSQNTYLPLVVGCVDMFHSAGQSSLFQVDNGNTPAADDPTGDAPDEPATSSQQGHETTEEITDEKTTDAEPAETTVKAAVAAVPAERTGSEDESRGKTETAAKPAENTETTAEPEDAEAGETSLEKTEIHAKQAAHASKMYSDEAAASAVGDSEVIETNTADELEETRSGMRSRASTESIDRELTNLALTAQLEQLAQQLEQGAFQFTSEMVQDVTTEESITEAEFTEANSAEANDTRPEGAEKELKMKMRDTEVQTGSTEARNTEVEINHDEVKAVEKNTEVKDSEVKDTEVKGNEVKDKEAKYTEANDTEVKDIEVKGTVVKDTEEKNTEVNDTEVKDNEVKDTEAKDAEAKDTEAKDTEVKDTEVKDNEVKDNEVKDNEVKDNEVKETEVKDIKVNDTEVKDIEKKDTEEKDTDVKDTEVKDTEVKDTEVKDTEVNDTEVNDTEEDTEVKDTEEKDTDVKDTDVKDNEVKDRYTVVKDTELKDTKLKDTKKKHTEKKHTKVKDTEVSAVTTDAIGTTTDTKRTTTKFTETVARSTAACFKPMDATTRRPVAPVLTEFPFSIEDVLKSGRLPPGFDYLPDLGWPLSDRPWPWAAAPGGAGRAVTADDRPTSQPQGGARRKVRPTKKSKGKHSHTIPPPTKQNGTARNDSIPRKLSETIGSELGTSPKKISAAVSTFRRKAAAACRTEVRRGRPFVGWVPGECCQTEEKKRVRGQDWWRAELQRRARRRGRAGRWFELRFERGVVHCDPPPPVKYTGKSYLFRSSRYSLN